MLDWLTRLAFASTCFPIRTFVHLFGNDDASKARDRPFPDGRREGYDLVVGADGIYSSTRRMVFDFTLAAEFTGQGVWRFTTSRPAEVERA